MELLEIEKELSGANAQSALERYDGVLVNLGSRARHAMDLGLQPEEYSKCSELVEAVTIARKLLRLQMRHE